MKKNEIKPKKQPRKKTTAETIKETANTVLNIIQESAAIALPIIQIFKRFK